MPLDLEAARAAMARYPSARSALLTLLWQAQEADGWVTPQTVTTVAELLGLTASEVESVLSFYSMYHRTPPAKRRLQVCRSLACAMKGAEEILSYLRSETGVGPGETAPDGSFSVEVVECLAACDHAPACLWNERMEGPLDKHGALERLRGDGGEPA